MMPSLKIEAVLCVHRTCSLLGQVEQVLNSG
jgi:hypothetical protein